MTWWNRVDAATHRASKSAVSHVSARNVDDLCTIAHLARPDGEGSWPAVLIGHDPEQITQMLLSALPKVTQQRSAQSCVIVLWSVPDVILTRC